MSHADEFTALVQGMEHVSDQLLAHLHQEKEKVKLLLAALKALFADYKALVDSGDAGNWHLEGLHVGQQALAAIAKAEGREP